MGLRAQISLLLLICLTVIEISSGELFGQSIQKNPVRDSLVSKSYPIDGTPLLWKHYQEAADYIASHPEFEKTKFRKTAAWNFQVGSTHSWWTVNMAKQTYYQDASTCRAIGSNCYIFVEDSMWTSGRVTQNAVDSIKNDFDNRTPANPSKGIYAMDTSAFGTPPDVDGDPKIIILILNIQDGYNGTGGYVAGFFDPNQETTGSYSNHAEILYIDANPTNLTTSDGIRTAMSTTAHEFQHMINWNYHQSTKEPTFIDESCSKLAEVYCGYPLFDLSLYANETNHFLFDWRTDDNTLVLNDYSRAQRFSLYIWDRFGIGIFKYIVQSTKSSPIDILNDALTKANTKLDFNGLFYDWLIANELNDTTVNRLYGYAYPGLPLSTGKNLYNANVSGTDTVQNLAAEYLIFRNGSDLSITFTNNSENPNLSVEALEMGSTAKKVVSVPFGSAFTVPEYGTTYSTVAFVVTNEDANNFIGFSYQATETPPPVTELKWDTTEPTGYYAWSTSDTICVVFDAFPYGILDSIRVALRNAGSIDGGIYQYTGSSRPSPLGARLAGITATISTTSQFPYPVPYKNWAGIDVTKQKISTDNPFAVAFVIGSDPKTPGVMVTDYPGTSAYHSYTYLNSSETQYGAGWYYITSSDTTVAIYLIRAYVSLTTGLKQAVELTPATFSLSQNYPNPFNPTTNIDYQISSPSHVTLKIYDVLGREIKTVVDEDKNPGKYRVRFEASNLPSGIYFYKLQAGSKVAVRKLVLLK
jgi:hypothetical protein